MTTTRDIQKTMSRFEYHYDEDFDGIKTVYRLEKEGIATINVDSIALSKKDSENMNPDELAKYFTK